MKQKNKQERIVIHVEIDGKHYYFGSIACIYEYFETDIIGITYGSLRNFGLSIDKQYKNNKCTIRKGILFAKSSNRGNNKA